MPSLFQKRRPILIPLALVLAVVLGTAVSSAAAPTEPAGITVLRSMDVSPDSLKYLLRWPQSVDAKGPAESYTLNVTSTKTGATLIVNRTAASLVDSFTVAKPVWGDSVSFTAKVQARRRALASAWASVTWKYRRVDSIPPTPGPITVDSSQVVAVSRADVRPIVVSVAPGDSVQLCAFVTLADGSKAMTEQAAGIAECRSRFAQYLSERSA
jgi:hypothetical protein